MVQNVNFHQITNLLLIGSELQIPNSRGLLLRHCEHSVLAWCVGVKQSQINASSLKEIASHPPEMPTHGARNDDPP